jgi:predicted 3-demethylubiquinone-9 3-methyltransferase (glyoxalase superfamily)
MQKLTPFLWFNDCAEQAVKSYTSIFKKSRVVKVARYDDASAKAAGRPKGSVMTIEFEIEGQRFIALNGGPDFKINEAVSFVVNCRTQAEINWYWKKLSAGGQEVQCGWLKDKFGVSWQVVPTILGELLSSRDPAKSQRVMEALLKMSRLNIKKLKQAAARK